MKITPGDYVNSGSTLLNLALTDTTTRGFLKGHYYRFVGDSSSGKTFLLLTSMAEASINPKFDNYTFYFDDTENGAGFDFEKFFGKKMAGRVKPPRGTVAEPRYSTTVEEYYDNLNDALDAGSCIYALDSMDSLDTIVARDRYTKQKSARKMAERKGKEVESAGSYALEKMKLNSQLLPKIIPKLRKTGSILYVIGQTRDRIPKNSYEAMFMGDETKVVGGGYALKFYTRCELWTSVKTHIKTDDKVRGQRRELGIVSTVRVKKNRQTGKDWGVDIPIYHQFGIDDTGCCIDYLIDTEEWEKVKGGQIDAPDITPNQPMRRDELIAYIEESPSRLKKLREAVRRVWKDIENKCRIERKSRYD